MADDPLESRLAHRGSGLDARDAAALGPDISLEVRVLFEQQAEIQAKLDALLPSRCMPSSWVERDMLRLKLRGLESYVRNQNLPGNIPVLSEVEEARSLQYQCECIEHYLIEEGIDINDARFLDTLLHSVQNEAPPGYKLWLDRNICHWDPLFRSWRTRDAAPSIIKRQVSFKCLDDQCVYHIYGFSKVEDRDQHMKRQHVPAATRGHAGGNVAPPAWLEQPQPRMSLSDPHKRSSPMPLLRLSVPSSSSTLPPLADIDQSRDRRGSVPAYGPATEIPSQHRSSIQIEAEDEPRLPPLKRARVGHSRLESIGELNLLRDGAGCIQCKVRGRMCDMRDPCFPCSGDRGSAGEELMAELGCHHGPLAELAQYMLPEALSPRQTHTPVTSPMARRRNMNEYLERTYVVSQHRADLVKNHLDFNDQFFWTEDFTSFTTPTPSLTAYSQEPKSQPAPVLLVFAASWNADGAPFNFWELFRLTRFISNNRESEATQYPVLFCAKLLLREILFYDLQQPEPAIRTDVNVSNAHFLPDDMDGDSRNRLIYDCMAQFLQYFEGVTSRKTVMRPRNWLAVFISLCIFSIVRTILADLFSTSSRNIPTPAQTGMPNTSSSMGMHSVYKALVHVFAWSTPMILDNANAITEMDENDRALFNMISSAIRKGEWGSWGIQSTKDFLLGLGSGYLIEGVCFNGFIRQRTPIYRHVSYTQPAAAEARVPRNSISEWTRADPWTHAPIRGHATVPLGIQQERRHTVAESPAYARGISRGLGSPTKLRTSYQRPPLRRVFCSKCNEYPEGFRGEHELRRHTDAKHAALVRRWVCSEPPTPSPLAPQPIIPLSKCKACVTQKKYGAYYNAAAHLRRAHFHPHKSGKASGDWPPMSILKDWMREVRQSVDLNEHDISSEEDNEVRMIEEFPLPRQPLFLEGPRLAPAPPQGPLLAPSVPSSLESTVNSSPNIPKAEDTRNRCPIPDCGRVFKDLVAHMLTHQEERPEKCPIETCEYHTKGFARKYDKNRHALTHYKGSMICPFCPGTGTAYEKAFNRADVFKRHLTSVHNVEQTPPNSRKMIPENSSRSGDAKCSICQMRFSTAQEFYEHLDDCVLNVIGTTPKVPRDRTSTPQKSDQKNVSAKTGDGADRSELPDGHSARRSAEISSTPGSAEHARETSDHMDVDLDRDRGD